MRWDRKGLTPAPWGEEAFDKGEDGLGQRKLVSVGVGSVEGGGEPVS